MKKRFLVKRSDGTTYYVDEAGQFIDCASDDKYYTAGERTEESLRESYAGDINKKIRSNEQEIEQIKKKLRDAGVEESKLDRKSLIEAYRAFGLTEAEAQVAADLQATTPEAYGLGLKF